MKKLTWLVILLAMTGICSCSPAKKPDPPQNRTIIVPEVSRVTFDAVDLKNAPKVVRDMAKVLEDQDASAWAMAGGTTYLLFSQGDKTGKYGLTVDEVLQRVPDQGFTWLDVRLKYKKKDGPDTNDGGSITAVRAEAANPPMGVGFTITGLPAAPPRGAPTPPPATPPAGQNVQISPGGAVIEQPAPNQMITSPVRVSGAVSPQGQKRVRISTRGGQIIKEENLPAAPGSGSFSIDMTYGPPETPAAGEIAIIDTAGADEKVLARVSVLIK
ncbi:MAG: Gmad2 immunoglobulin-like domain-containing protein [Bacillota bacterium]